MNLHALLHCVAYKIYHGRDSFCHITKYLKHMNQWRDVGLGRLLCEDLGLDVYNPWLLCK